MPYNAMKNRAFVPEEKFMREALSLPSDNLLRSIPFNGLPE